MELHVRKEKLTYKGEEFEIDFSYYKSDGDLGDFTTTELDEINMWNLYEAYNQKYSINKENNE